MIQKKKQDIKTITTYLRTQLAKFRESEEKYCSISRDNAKDLECTLALLEILIEQIKEETIKKAKKKIERTHKKIKKQ